MFAPDSQAVYAHLTGRATTTINDDGGYATGNLPTNLLGGEEFVKRDGWYTAPCEKAPKQFVPTNPALATLDEVVAYLRTYGTAFADSLVAYHEKHGRLSEKQEKYARAFYRKWHDACEWSARHFGHAHDWTPQGTVVWGNNTHLGTWSKTEYSLCAHCGLWLGQYSYNNYSGD